MIIMNLSNILRENIQLYKSQMIQKKVKLLRQWGSDMTVYSDDRHLRLITRDLVPNIISFTHEDGTIKLLIENIDGIDLSISEQDQGLPIDQSARNGYKHFEKGLGLSLSLKLLEENECKLEIENIPDLGTSIHIFIPRKKYINAKTELQSKEVQIIVGGAEKEDAVMQTC